MTVSGNPRFRTERQFLEEYGVDASALNILVERTAAVLPGLPSPVPAPDPTLGLTDSQLLELVNSGVII